MRFADRPTRFDEPGECAIIPGRVHDENGGVLLDGVYDGARGDMRLWLSYAGLQKIVSQFGDRLNLSTRGDLDEALSLVRGLQGDLDRARAERDDALAKLDRISGLRRDGFQVSRIQGRPKTKATS